MRVLILHSDVAPGAPPEDLDTLAQVEAIDAALTSKGHAVARASFHPDPATLKALIARLRPDIVFNLVEAVWGKSSHAPIPLMMLDELGVPYTGGTMAALALSGDKLLAKRMLRVVGLPTPDWADPPEWAGLDSGRWIVKSVDEDSSLGLDDAAVADGRAAVLARAEHCAKTYGGRWFAEKYIEGREFNVAIIERNGAPCVLPVAEMAFENWDKGRPRIMGASAKWDCASPDFNCTVWKFDGVEEPALHAQLAELALRAFTLFGLSGYARADFRVDETGRPFILELNPNPSLAFNCGLVASATQAGLSYADLIESILHATRV